MVEQKTMAELRERIREIASTLYESYIDQARDYLLVIESAEIKKQPELFALVLFYHGASLYKKRQLADRNNLSEKKYREITERIVDTVTSWVQNIIKNNAGLEETADFLWQALNQYEGEDKLVAFSLLLQGEVMPYAQVPLSLIALAPIQTYLSQHENVIRYIGLFKRIMNFPHSILEMAAAIVRILDKIEDEESKIHFLAFVLGSFQELSARSKGIVFALNSLINLLRKE